MKRRKRIRDYGPELRGLVTNRFGGNKLQRERGLKGATYGPAGKVRTYTKEERGGVDDHHRAGCAFRFIIMKSSTRRSAEIASGVEDQRKRA